MNKKTSILIVAILNLVIACSQSSENKITNQDSFRLINDDTIVKGISYEGKLKESISFIDTLGKHLVIITETGIYKNAKFKHPNKGRDAELFAYHFLVNNDKPEQIWKIYDFVRDCPVDIEAQFIKHTLQATDLNKDGNAEIWVMYKKVCHGDVSPCDMKIIMYQGNQKFAMRGENKVDLGDGSTEGGDYQFDSHFSNAPKEFREFAIKMWNEHIMQEW